MDNEVLEESDRIIFESDGDVYVVIIFFIEIDDEVEYKCVVQNEFGKVFC